jgi:hypothetical protein
MELTSLLASKWPVKFPTKALKTPNSYALLSTVKITWKTAKG